MRKGLDNAQIYAIVTNDADNVDNLGCRSVGIGQIEGGVVGSAVPGECTMRFDLKYLPSVYGLRGERTVTDSEQVKREVRISGFPAGCDARHFALHGIPAVIFGPGDLRNAHSVDEHVSVDEYLLCLETVARAVSDWCGVAK